MKITNKYGLPKSLVNAVSRDNYSRGNAQRSVTQLIGSPRIALLRERHQDDIEVDVSDQIWSLMGKALHWVAEHGADGKDCVEQRLFAKVNGWTISGQIDLQIHNGKTVDISDYKLTSVYNYQNYKRSWEDQLNCYAWLVETQTKYKVGKLQIICIMRDWQSAKKGIEGYPDAAIQIVPIPNWGLEKQTEYIHFRVRAHQQADLLQQLGSDIPLCTDEERWVRGEKWAVLQSADSKRALRVFDTEEAARAYAEKKPGSIVQFRPGVAVCCEGNYCSVAPWCTQREREIKFQKSGITEGN